jgi:L-threonylcarbamoyladenylate synthase
MNTQILPIDPEAPDAAIIKRAAALLRDGALVAFPTETVYGLGANALDGEALGRIFEAKKRPRSDPIIAHIASMDQLETLTRDVPAIAAGLADAFWPGPLTMIFKRAETVPDAIAEGRDTVAIRMPAHPVARALLVAAGVPVGAPSANTFTRPSATTAEHVKQDLMGRIAMILDGGPSTIGLESTVLDLTASTPRVLRPGGVTLEALQGVIPDVSFSPAYVSITAGSDSPGQMLKHYSPRARVLLFRGADDERCLRVMRERAEAEAQRGTRVGALLFDEDADALGSSAIAKHMGRAQDLGSVGQHLFASLRDLDAEGVDIILVRDPGRAGLGAALWDRLLRAAEGAVIDV